MPKITQPLTNTEVSKARYIDKNYKLYDGKGLQLLITKNSKIWQFAYQRPITKKANTLSIGNFVDVSLAQARQKRKEYRELLAQDIDPAVFEDERKRKALITVENTFSKLADEWFERQNYRSPATAIIHLRYAKEVLGDKAVTDITAYDVLQLCRIYESQKKYTTAKAVKVKVSQVLKYCITIGILERNVVSDLDGALISPATTSKNFPAIIEPDDFAQLLRDIDDFNKCTYITKQAIKLGILLFPRSIDLRSMHVDDIDFERKQWRYTPQKTSESTKVAMITPLPDQAIKIIQECLYFNESKDLVLPSSASNKSMLDRTTLSKFFLSLGYKNRQTFHGLRASARTLIEEELEYDPRYIEMQLGHVVKDSNGTAYARSKFVKQRTVMMQDWADYLDELKK